MLEMPNWWELGFLGHKGRSKVKGRVPVKLEENRKSQPVRSEPEPPAAGLNLPRRSFSIGKGRSLGLPNGKAGVLLLQPIIAGRR